MLKFGGYINIFISVAHLIGLIWADKMYEVTGIGKEMEELSRVHSSLPYILTVFVAILFFIFGLYGLSADNKFRKIPFLKLGIFVIAALYICRGLGELMVGTFKGTNSIIETIYSLFALTIGLLFLIGGLRKWKLTTDIK